MWFIAVSLGGKIASDSSCEYKYVFLISPTLLSTYYSDSIGMNLPKLPRVSFQDGSLNAYFEEHELPWMTSSQVKS